MKKTISLLFALACVFSLSAKTIYLNTGGSSLWGTSSPEFFVHAWGAGDTDVHMTLLSGDIYQAEIPDGSTSCIFTRQKTSSTTIIWDYNNGLLNRTGDETIGSNNCFTITGWGSGYQANCTGTWSTYTPTVTPEPEPDTPDTPHDTLRIYCKMTQSWWTTDGAAVGIYCYNSSDAKNANWPGVRMTAVAGETGLWYADVDVTTYTSVIFTRVNGTGTIADWGAKTKNLTIPADGTNCFTITSSTAVWGNPGCDGTWSTYTPSTEPVNNITMYYVNTTAWDNVYAYVFVGEAKEASWPGEAMTKTTLTKNGFDVYSYEFPETYTSIIFSNKGNNQTKDLTIDITKPYYYDGTWYASLDEIPEPCTPEYGVMVGDTYTAATINPNNTAEYMLTGLKLSKDDTFTIYDACTKTAWVITTFKEGSTSNITIVDNKYVAGATGSYDLYFELSLSGDKIYINYTPSTPTEVINASTVLDVNAPIYNLLGVQVDSNYKGVVLQNGQKFIQK